MLNSRQGLFTVTPKRSAGLPLHAQGRSFSQSYGAILPSSLTRVLPVALVYSTCPPVSVMRYGHAGLTRGFSRQLGLNHFWPCGTAITPQHQAADLPTTFISLQAWNRNPITGWLTLLRHPIAQTTRRGTGILTRCPSPTPCGLGLGPTDPTPSNVASETSGIRRARFSRALRYSSQHSHFCALQQSLRSAFPARRTLPYCSTSEEMKPAASVPSLAPYIVGAGSLDQ